MQCQCLISSLLHARRFWPNNKSRMYLLENTGERILRYDFYPSDLDRHIFSLSCSDLNIFLFFSTCRRICSFQWASGGGFHSDLLRCQVGQICNVLFLSISLLYMFVLDPYTYACKLLPSVWVYLSPNFFCSNFDHTFFSIKDF